MVARPLSLEEQLSRFLTELLDSPCADAHLVKLTEYFSEWQIISTGWICQRWRFKTLRALAIGLKNAARQRLEMFTKWREKKKSQATRVSAINFNYWTGVVNTAFEFYNLCFCAKTFFLFLHQNMHN